MFSHLIIKGWLIGFSIAMPVGPIGLLCIRNSLTYGMMCGLVSGLGAALADAIYGALAGLGITAVSNFLEQHQTHLQLVGSLFLCYLGIRTFFAAPRTTSHDMRAMAHSRVFFTTFLLTLTNPMTIVSFAGIYAGLGVGNVNVNFLHTAAITLGVFIGSAAWWLILSFISAKCKERINASMTLWLNRISGLMLIFFGIIILMKSSFLLF